MANYGTKYRMRWASPTGTCTVKLQLDGYSSGVTDLTPADPAIEVTWGQQRTDDLTTPLMVSTARLRFLGDVDGGKVQEIFDGGDTEWRVRFEQDGALLWQGFLATDLWEDNPHLSSETVELEAIDGLALLENRAADDLLPNVWSQLMSVRDLHALPVSVNMEWYPYSAPPIPANDTPLDPNVDNVGALAVPQTYFYSELNDDGSIPPDAGPIDERPVVEDLLERFRLHLFQSGGKWHIRQRHRIQPDGTIKRWEWDGTSMSSPSVDDITTGFPAAQRTERPRSRVQQMRDVQSVYSYNNLGNLIANPGFEEGLGSWETIEPVENATQSEVYTELYDNTPLDQPSTQENSYAVTVERQVSNPDGGDPNVAPPATLIQDVAATIYDQGPRAGLTVSWDEAHSITSTAAEITIGLGGYYLQRRTVKVIKDALQGETGSLFVDPVEDGASTPVVIPEGAVCIIRDGTGVDAGVVGSIELAEAVKPGADKLNGNVSSDVSEGDRLQYYVWASQETTIHEPRRINQQNVLVPQELTVPLRTLSSVVVEGEPYIEYTIAPDDPPTTADKYVRLDNFSMAVSLNGEPIERTSYIAVDDQYGRELTLQHRTGDGPTAGHERGLVLPGGPSRPFCSKRTKTGGLPGV
jgi:hypothetical protein